MNYKKIILIFFLITIGCNSSKLRLLRFVDVRASYLNAAESLLDLELVEPQIAITGIEGLVQKKYDLAILPLIEIRKQIARRPRLSEKIKVITPLYFSEMHFLISRSSLKYKSSHKKSLAMISQSQTLKKLLYQFSNCLSSTGGYYLKEYKQLTLSAAILALRKKTLDGLLLFSHEPGASLAEFSGSLKRDIRLIGSHEIDYRCRRSIMRQNAVISARSYFWLDKNIRTLAIDLVLVGRARLSVNVVKNFLKQMYQNRAALVKADALWQYLDTDYLTRVSTTEPRLMHKGVAKFLKNRIIRIEKLDG